MKPSAMRPRPEMTMRATPLTPPAHIAAAAFEVPAGNSQASDCNNWSDDVAAPVHDVENRAFNSRRLLALHRFVECWSGSKVLRACGERCGEISQDDDAQSKHQGGTNPVRCIGPEDDCCGWCGGHRRAPPEGWCDSHTFLSWTRLLWASVSRQRVWWNHSSVKLGNCY